MNKFVNSLNARTPTKKVWEKFRKLNKNYIPRIVPPLDRGGNIISSSDKIADRYAYISKDPYKKSKPGKNRKEKNFYTPNHLQTEN